MDHARSFLKVEDDLRLGYEELSKFVKTLPERIVTPKAKAMVIKRKKEIENVLERIRKETFDGKFI